MIDPRIQEAQRLMDEFRGAGHKVVAVEETGRPLEMRILLEGKQPVVVSGLFAHRLKALSPKA